MAKQEKRVHKKLGRPPGRTYGETIPVRLTPEDVAAVDSWIEEQPAKVSRSEAIRRLLRAALAAGRR